MVPETAAIFVFVHSSLVKYSLLGLSYGGGACQKKKKEKKRGNKI
jgi:hypothetical protein